MIAITGATGQLGRLIIDNLLDKTEAAQLIGIVRSPDKAANLVEKGMTIRYGDYADYDSLVAAFAHVKKLLFISNMNLQSRQVEHGNVVKAAAAAGIGHIIYTSIINPDTPNPLNQSHKMTEDMIRASGIPYTILQNSFYMDSYLVEVEIAIEQGVYRTPTDSDVGVALISRADIARAAAEVLMRDEHENRVYALTGTTLVTPTTFAEVASAVSGQEVKHEQITWDELSAIYIARGMSPEYAQMSVMLEKMIASGTLANLSEDVQILTERRTETLLEMWRRLH